MNKKSFNVGLALFFTLSLSVTEGYSQPICTPPVMLQEDGSTHATLMDAYNYAVGNGTLSAITLQLASGSLEEEVNFSGNLSVVLEGGYDDCNSFIARSSTTGIIGSITISGGTITFDNIAAMAPPPCPEGEEDIDGDGYTALGSMCGGSVDDCNDTNANIHPDAVETYNDGIDQNCDGKDLSNPSDALCSDCHDAYWIDSGHRINMAPDGTCVNCHATAVTSILDWHYGLTVKTSGNNMAAGTTIGCVSCHDESHELYTHAGTSVVMPKVWAVWPNETCDTCHGDRAQFHEAKHKVQVGANDLSYDPPGQPCGNCHVVADWIEIEGTEHNVDTNGAGSCATCHNSPRIQVQNVIIAAANPTNCLDCHSDKELTPHGNVDHALTGRVTIESACVVCHPDPATTFTSSGDNKIHNDCTTCHDTTTNALKGSAIGHGVSDAGFGNPNVCTTCHTGRTWTDHDIDHAGSGYVTLYSDCTGCHSETVTTGQDFISATNDKKHDACTICHAADGSQSTGAGDCSLCHSSAAGDWTTHTQDHTGKVTAATGCVSCHSATVDYANFVDTANNKKHDDCYACHNLTTKLPIASAGDCSRCHSGIVSNFATHATQDHSAKVTSAAGCVSCHSATVDYANFVDAANDLKHDGCTSCHNAATNAPIATAGDCSQCHSGVTSNFAAHATQDHTAKVTLQSECTGCHDITVDYANFIDAANDKKHDGCTSCHNSSTNAPIATAGDCSQCHTANYFASHVHTHTVERGTGDLSNGQYCSNCHVVANWSEIEGTEHNVDTNGTGSCSTCHNSPRQEVIDTINAGADPTNCLDCHSDKTTGHGSIDHRAVGYVTVGGTQDYYGTTCASCHDSSGTTDTIADIHQGNCNNCHTSVPNLQPGVPAGGGDCVTCHTGTTASTGSVHTLWGRYMDTCANCHTSFEGGPGGSLHDLHTTGWSSYPTDYPGAMWEDAFPLNIDCATCHKPEANSTKGQGCATCHTFEGKAGKAAHLLHSDGSKKGGLEIACTACHWNS
jgi:hypothetical protein